MELVQVEPGGRVSGLGNAHGKQTADELATRDGIYGRCLHSRSSSSAHAQVGAPGHGPWHETFRGASVAVPLSLHMSSERTPFASKKARNFLSSGCVQPVLVCVELMQLFSHSPLRSPTHAQVSTRAAWRKRFR